MSKTEEISFIKSQLMKLERDDEVAEKAKKLAEAGGVTLVSTQANGKWQATLCLGDDLFYYGDGETAKAAYIAALDQFLR
jgi:hypothetical protein